MSAATRNIDGRATATVLEIRIGSAGSNVPCMNDIEAFSIHHNQTENVTTALQKDFIVVKLGYITNTGEWHTYNSVTDD